MSGPVHPYVDARRYPVVDRLLVAYFAANVGLADDTPVHWATALAADVEYPAGRVMRLPGGGINSDHYQDTSRIEVTTWGRDRVESDALTAQVRQLMADLDCGDYLDISIDRVQEDLGPGRVPDPNEDLRAVPTVWSVVARQHYAAVGQ